MNRSDPASSTDAEVHSSGPACAKCGHVNPRNANVCEKCQAHLWVVCHHCGKRNRRSDNSCVECDHRLHRSMWRRVSKKLTGDRRNISLWQIVLLIVVVWCAYKVVIYFAEYRPPSPE